MFSQGGKYMKISKVKIAVLFLTVVVMLLSASVALANNSNGTEFQTIFDRVIGWVTGMPAIIIAIGVAILGVVRAFQAGSFMWAFAGIIVAALIFVLPAIVAGLGGTTF